MEVAKPCGHSNEKSVHIRVKIDVRRPLRDSIRLKVRDRQIISIPVKYERLPMICFYCGRLGHGTNDCMEVDGDSTPEKTFGPSLRVSPWKLFKDEEADMHDDKGEGKRTSVARKFFITKERDQECRKVDKELIDEVADFFHKVSLVHDEGASEISGAGGTESTSGYRDDDSS